MRRKDKEITSPDLLNEILSKSEVCRLGMIDKGIPYIVPMNYGYYENALYFHSALNGRKIDILSENNYVCFEIEYSSEIIKGTVACDWTTKYRSLIGYGRIEIIREQLEKIEGLNIIMRHYGRSIGLEYDDNNLGRINILKLNIESITGKQSGKWD